MPIRSRRAVPDISMKAAIHAASALLIALSHVAPLHAQPPRAPVRPPAHISADWQAQRSNASMGASAPRGNLRGDIESNTRWNDNGRRPRSPRRR
jgi:hypothetical protein